MATYYKNFQEENPFNWRERMLWKNEPENVDKFAQTKEMISEKIDADLSTKKYADKVKAFVSRIGENLAKNVQEIFKLLEKVKSVEAEKKAGKISKEHADFIVDTAARRFDDMELSEADLKQLDMFITQAEDRLKLREEHMEKTAQAEVAGVEPPVAIGTLRPAPGERETISPAVARYLAPSAYGHDDQADGLPSDPKEAKAYAAAQKMMKQAASLAPEPDTDSGGGSAVPEEAHDAEYWENTLEGRSAILHEDFKKENSYDHLAKLAYGGVEYAKEIMDAINAMRIIRNTALVSHIDNRHMWDELRKGMVFKGEGKFTMTFDEMAKAVYGRKATGADLIQLYKDNLSGGVDQSELLKGKREKLKKIKGKLEGNPDMKSGKKDRLTAERDRLIYEIAQLERQPMLEKFFEASEALIKYLPQAKETGVSVETYRKNREEAIEGLEGDESDMAATTELFFDPYNYGPVIKLGLFRSIAYKFKDKDRPTMTQDFWMSETKLRDYDTYGEREYISHAHAFDELMKSESIDEYVATVNKYIELGKASLLAYKSLEEIDEGFFETGAGDITGLTRAEIEAVTMITAEDVRNPDLSVDPALVAAVRHGAMAEAAKDMAQSQKEKATKTADSTPEALSTNPVAQDLALQATKGEGLSSKQRQALEDDTTQAIYGVMAGLAEFHDGTFKDLQAKLGVAVPINNRFKLEFNVTGSSFDDGEVHMSLVSLTSGVAYSSKRFGKRNKLKAGAYANMSYSPGEKEGDRWMPHVGAWLKRDINESGTWAAKGDISASLEAVSLCLGVERDFGRIMKQRVEKFKTKNAEELKTAKEGVTKTIDDMAISAPEKAALKGAIDDYLDEMISMGVMNDFSKFKLRNCIRFVGAGLSASAAWKKDKHGNRGAGWGPYITIAVGPFIPVTIYLPPPADIDSILDPESGAAVSITPPTTNVVKATMKAEYLYGSPELADEARTRAAQDTEAAIKTLNEGLPKEVELVPGENFVGLEFHNLQGVVRLYIDPNADFELIRKEDGSLGLNLDRSDHPIIHINKKPASHGSQDQVEIVLTSDPSATPQAVMDRTPDYVTWVQYKDTISENKVASNAVQSDAANGSKLYLGAAANDLTPGTLSHAGAQRLVKEIRWTDVELTETIAAQSLFSEFSPEARQMAQEIAEGLKAKGIDYRKLSTSGHEEEINAAIVESYREKGIANPNFDQIYLAHQYAMQLDRPKNHTSAKWNIEAAKNIAGDKAELLIKQLEEHMQEYVDGKGKGTFPEGSEFFLFINEKGDKKLLEGYYDKDIHGEIVGATKWDPANPEKTLTALGINEDVVGTETYNRYKQVVIDFAKFLKEDLPWPKPFTNESEATLNKTAYTVAGELLLSQAETFFGEADAAELRQMILSGSITNRTLANEFRFAVYELYKNPDHNTHIRNKFIKMDTEVYTGLYDQCLNLAFARNFVLKYGGFTEGMQEVKVAHGTREEEEMLKSTAGIGQAEITIRPGIYLPIPEVKKDNATKDAVVDLGGPRPLTSLRPEDSKDGESSSIQEE